PHETKTAVAFASRGAAIPCSIIGRPCFSSGPRRDTIAQRPQEPRSTCEQLAVTQFRREKMFSAIGKDTAWRLASAVTEIGTVRLHRSARRMGSRSQSREAGGSRVLARNVG